MAAEWANVKRVRLKLADRFARRVLLIRKLLMNLRQALLAQAKRKLLMD